jgi:hypothetical protein
MIFRITLFTLIFCQLCAETLVDFKVGYFNFSDQKMSKVFNEGGVDLQLSVSYPFYRWLQLYGSLEYCERRGRSLGLHEKTHFYAVPISLGLKSVFSICQDWSFFAALGPRFFLVKVRSNTDLIPHHIERNGWGGFAGGGFMYHYGCCMLQLFGEYSWKQMQFRNYPNHVYGKSVNVGGGTIGGGVGYLF